MKKSFMKKLSLLLAVAVFITSIALGWNTKAEAASTRTKTISISDSAQITVVKGGYYTFKPVITPANSTDYLRYVSSDPSVVQVNLYTGKMKAIKPGKATITVISKATKATKNSDKANVKDSVVVKVASNYATTSTWAETLIKSPASGTVKLSSKNAVKITTPAGNFTNKYLVVNVPEGHVVNNGTFKSISVYDVKDASFYENAKGNTFTVFDKDARFVVTDKASVKALTLKANGGTLKLIANGPVQNLNVSGANNTVNLVANSTLGTVELSGKTALSISGKSKTVEVTFAAGAENSTITNNLNNGTLKVTNNTVGVITVTNANGTKTEVKAGEASSVATDATVTPTPTPTTTPSTGGGSGTGGNGGSTTTYKTVTVSNTGTYDLPVAVSQLKSVVVKIDGVDDYSVNAGAISYVNKLISNASTYIEFWKGISDYTVNEKLNDLSIRITGEAGKNTKTVTFDGYSYEATLNANNSIDLKKVDGTFTYNLSKVDEKTLKIVCNEDSSRLEKVSFYVGY